MSHLMRKLLAAVAACALTSACFPNISGDQTTNGAQYLRRWKVTDASGKVLSQGCTQQEDLNIPMNVIDVHAAGGSVITYEDNLGMEYVAKSRVEQQLPTSDAYWCGNQDVDSVYDYSSTSLDTVQVADADPPATIEKIDLINPYKDSQGQTWGTGIRLRLRVQHPGVLDLGLVGSPDPDAGADAGPQLYDIYPAMTLE